MDDLEDVWEFENQFSGDDDVSLETLRTWWWRYSRMALLVRDESGQIVGTFDASPRGGVAESSAGSRVKLMHLT